MPDDKKDIKDIPGCRKEHDFTVRFRESFIDYLKKIRVTTDELIAIVLSQSELDLLSLDFDHLRGGHLFLFGVPILIDPSGVMAVHEKRAIIRHPQKPPFGCLLCEQQHYDSKGRPYLHQYICEDCRVATLENLQEQLRKDGYFDKEGTRVPQSDPGAPSCGGEGSGEESERLSGEPPQTECGEAGTGADSGGPR